MMDSQGGVGGSTSAVKLPEKPKHIPAITGEVVDLNRSILFTLLGMFVSTMMSLTVFAQSDRDALRTKAVAESLIPVRPGVPGKVPFWNVHSRRFPKSDRFQPGSWRDTSRKGLGEGE